MAPTRSRQQRKSTESQSSVDTTDFPEPPQMIPTIVSTPSTSPARSPIKKAPRGLTAAQKQALMDNLQLEITERARKLRAQYNLQAQGLRTRIEIRVNRIPTAMRKLKMGDLIAKYSEAAPKQPAARTILPGMAPKPYYSPKRNLLQEKQRMERQGSPSPMRPTKRNSDEMDKENTDISNPKKRAKAAPAQASRVASRTKQASAVLSPRSPNARNISQARSPPPPRPQNPIGTHFMSPTKSYLARPVSPAKPLTVGGTSNLLTSMVAKAKSTRVTATRKVTHTSATSASSAASTTTKTAASRAKKESAPILPPKSRIARKAVRNSLESQSSEGSQGTTIVRKAIPVKKEPAAKRTVMGTIKQIGGTRKATGTTNAATTAAATAAPATTRTLRSKRAAA